MNRLLPLLAACLVLLVSPVGAQDPAPPSPAVLRMQMFVQDQDLIHTLVKGSVQLAAAADALQRAECCSSVAERVATALEQAACQQDKARVAELGLHLRSLLETGVAANLRAAHRPIPAGSMLEQNLRAVREHTAQLMEPMEDELLRLTDAEETIEHMLKALDVDKAVPHSESR